MTAGKVLIVGGGIAGLSVAWGLVRRGFAVELFEQGQGNRISKHAEQPGEVFVIPSGALEFSAHGVF